MKEITIISRDRNRFIELVHRRSHPTVWIVKQSKKFLWFKESVSSRWFIDGRQALGFAESLKRIDGQS